MTLIFKVTAIAIMVFTVEVVADSKLLEDTLAKMQK